MDYSSLDTSHDTTPAYQPGNRPEPLMISRQESGGSSLGDKSGHGSGPQWTALSETSGSSCSLTTIQDSDKFSKSTSPPTMARKVFVNAGEIEGTTPKSMNQSGETFLKITNSSGVTFAPRGSWNSISKGYDQPVREAAAPERRPLAAPQKIPAVTANHPTSARKAWGSAPDNGPSPHYNAEGKLELIRGAITPAKTTGTGGDRLPKASPANINAAQMGMSLRETEDATPPPRQRHQVDYGAERIRRAAEPQMRPPGKYPVPPARDGPGAANFLGSNMWADSVGRANHLNAHAAPDSQPAKPDHYATPKHNTAALLGRLPKTCIPCISNMCDHAQLVRCILEILNNCTNGAGGLRA